jgi:hypothetical protein
VQKTKTILHKYFRDFRHLPVRQRLLISFFVKWIFWSLIWLLARSFLLFQEWTVSHILFFSSMMALLQTVPFNREEISALFRKKKGNPTSKQGL